MPALALLPLGGAAHAWQMMIVDWQQRGTPSVALLLRLDAPSWTAVDPVFFPLPLPSDERRWGACALPHARALCFDGERTAAVRLRARAGAHDGVDVLVVATDAEARILAFHPPAVGLAYAPPDGLAALPDFCETLQVVFPDDEQATLQAFVWDHATVGAALNAARRGRALLDGVTVAWLGVFSFGHRQWWTSAGTMVLVLVPGDDVAVPLREQDAPRYRGEGLPPPEATDAQCEYPEHYILLHLGVDGRLVDAVVTLPDGEQLLFHLARVPGMRAGALDALLWRTEAGSDAVVCVQAFPGGDAARAERHLRVRGHATEEQDNTRMFYGRASGLGMISGDDTLVFLNEASRRVSMGWQ